MVQFIVSFTVDAMINITYLWNSYIRIINACRYLNVCSVNKTTSIDIT